MKLQRTLPLLLLLALLAGCGTSSQPSALTAEERTQLYQTAIESARDAEMNEVIGILTDTGDDMADVIFELLGVTAADMSAFALSVSPMNIKAYGIAAIYPAAGKSDAVLEGLNAFIDRQKQSFEQYLADQYEIASNARLETLEDGTILLVMCEDQDAVFDAIETRSRRSPEPKNRLIQPEKEPGGSLSHYPSLRSLWQESFRQPDSSARQGLRRPRRWIIMEHTTVRSTLEVLVCKRAQAVSCFPSFPCRGPMASAPLAFPPGASSTFWPRPGRSSGRFSPWFLPAAVIPPTCPHPLSRATPFSWIWRS